MKTAREENLQFVFLLVITVMCMQKQEELAAIICATERYAAHGGITVTPLNDQPNLSKSRELSAEIQNFCWQVAFPQMTTLLLPLPRV